MPSFGALLPDFQRLLALTTLACGLSGGLAWAQDAPGAASGEELYRTHCASCHRDHGRGFWRIYPPLARSDYLLSDVDRAIGIIYQGLEGPIEVNGKTYDREMAAVELADEEVVAVMNYVLHAWDNDGPTVDLARVQRAKARVEAQQ